MDMEGGGRLAAHRGAMILVFGILGIVVCFIFGIVAWVMGNGDLRQMDAGQMDPEGRGLTSAGKTCGIVSVALTALGLLVYILIFVVLVAGGTALQNQ